MVDVINGELTFSVIVIIAGIVGYFAYTKGHKSGYCDGYQDGYEDGYDDAKTEYDK